MAQRRCLYSLSRHATALLYSTRAHLHHALETFPSLSKPITASKSISTWRTLSSHRYHSRFFSSSPRDNSEKGKEDDDDDADDVDSEEVMEDENDSEDVEEEKDDRVYSAEEKVAEAEEIGYKVIGPLQKSDRVFKPYEPVFAVVQIGSHQFKVSNRDSIFTERLKFCDVNDKLILNKVLLLGSSTQTIVGRPIVPDAAVHAVVEEHALDAKVIIFKKKRRKNYRRTKGHRQELTKLRITDIQGIEKPELKVDRNPKKAPLKKEEKTAVAA